MMNAPHQYERVPAGANNAPSYGQPGYGQPGNAPPSPGFSPGVRPGGSTSQNAAIMKMCFFAASCCIMVGALLNIVALILSFRIVDILNLVYIFMFGCALAVLDSPFFNFLTRINNYKVEILKYAKILTRIMGKGVCFLFVGSTLLSIMWSTTSAVFMKIIAVLLNSFVILVGIGLIVSGFLKSRKLKNAQMHLSGGVLESQYQRYARAPQYGLTPPEFNNLTTDNGGNNFEDHDLVGIFDALSTAANIPVQPGAEKQHRLTLDDMMQWVQGGTVFL